MKSIKSFLISVVILFTIWIFLAGTSSQEMIFGGISVVLLSLIFHKKMSILGDIKLNPKSIVFFILYIFVFLWELIKSNLDVAMRVVSPKLKIKPGIVKVKTKLKSPLGRAFLANSITLTPGTLTVEMKDEFFYIHWIEVESADIEGATNAIVSKFEKYLEVIFG